MKKKAPESLDLSKFGDDSIDVQTPGIKFNINLDSPGHSMILRPKPCSPALLKASSPIRKEDSKQRSPVRKVKPVKVATCLSGALSAFSNSFLSRAKKAKESPQAGISAPKKKKANNQKCDAYGWEAVFRSHATLE